MCSQELDVLFLPGLLGVPATSEIANLSGNSSKGGKNGKGLMARNTRSCTHVSVMDRRNHLFQEIQKMMSVQSIEKVCETS